MKKHECKVCGEKFYLLKENKYIAKKKSGMFNTETLFEAFDCPYCGCQNIVNVREYNDESKFIEVCKYKGDKS